jgi:tetratricopeptide (TPR) repeat protein
MDLLKIINKHHKITILVIAIVVVYINSIGNNLVSDDISILVINQRNTNIREMFSDPTKLIDGFIYYFGYKFFGPNAVFFRLLNIVFHTGNSIFIFLILSKLHKKKVAFFATLIFAIHPILVESVSWITGGAYARYAFFFLTSFYLYLKSKDNNRLYFISIFFWFLSLEASEKALPLSFIFPIYEYLQGNLKQKWKACTPFIALSTIWLVNYGLRIGTRREDLRAVYQTSVNFRNNFYSIPIAITEYLKLIFWPKGLTLYHTELTFNLGQIIFRSFTAILLTGLAIFEFSKKNMVSFWFFWFVLAIGTTIAPFGIAWIVAERYVYLGSIGIIVIFSLFINFILEKYKLQGFYWSLLILIIIPLSIRTAIRNTDWKNQDSLWIATSKTSPTSPQNHNNLGDMYGRRGDLKMAVLEFETAIKLKPNYADAYHNLANTYQQIGDLEKSKENYLKAIQFNPNLWQSFQNLGVIYYHEKNIAEAVKYFEKALEINPNNGNLEKLVGQIQPYME